MLANMWLYPPPQSETAQAREQEGSKGGFPCFHFALAGEGYSNTNVFIEMQI